MDKRLEKLRQEYKDTPIPEELNYVVSRALKQRRKRSFHYKWIVGASTAAVIFITGINSSPIVANAFADLPVVGKIVSFLTFREYKIEDEHFSAEIKIPAITNLENKELESYLNSKYIEENQRLYDQFVAEMEELKATGAYLGVASDYEVMTDNERILSIRRSVLETAASSAETRQYDTIDKQKEVLITLPSLFKDESYVQVISEYIQGQMLEDMKQDEGKVYWVKNEEGEEDEEFFADAFESIDREQSFYITEDHQLVISFDEYEVAPGYMGVVEFVIPTEKISSILVSNEYIK